MTDEGETKEKSKDRDAGQEDGESKDSRDSRDSKEVKEAKEAKDKKDGDSKSEEDGKEEKPKEGVAGPPRRRPKASRWRRMLRQLLFEEQDDPGFDEALIRTYLANERTFLAWLRTAVVLLGVGLGAVALGGTGQLSETLAFILGGVSAFTGILMVLWAYISFGSTTAGIEKRVYRPARSFVALAALLIIVTNSVVLVLLFVEAID